MKNNDNLAKKEKKVNKIKEQLARLREKLASENKNPSFPSKSKFKKTEDKAKQPKKEEIKVKSKQPKKEEIKVKLKKVKEVKEQKAGRKEEAKKKAKEAKEKEEEAKKKEEEAKKKEEEAKKTYEELLEEQLTEEEITGFQIDRTDMDRLSNKVCEIVAGYETEGMFQSELWKKLKLSSRDGSRLALKLERMGMISREKILENGRWTYKLIIKRTPVSTSSLEGAPCLICPVEAQCSIDGEISPKTCQYIADWVHIESKHSN